VRDEPTRVRIVQVDDVVTWIEFICASTVFTLVFRGVSAAWHALGLP
jgi:hypothetical protein